MRVTEEQNEGRFSWKEGKEEEERRKRKYLLRNVSNAILSHNQAHV